MNEDTTGRKCSRCGAGLPADAPEGLCPRCLLALNLTAPTEEVGPEGTRIIPAKSQPPPLDEIAKLFPQFEILELLGRGGMGFVYKARQPRLDRLVALKVLAPDPDNRGRFAERFEREAQALAKLSHPNIVSVYEFGESGGFYYLVMEFVDGMNLRQLFGAQKLKPEEALVIVPAICDALQYAHTRGIVHRDIKPENILLDKQGGVKIADFGIAKILGTEPKEPLTQDQQAIGTPHYMAPEQIEKPTEVDHRADIYSLGVVFYEMLTGELPLGKFAPPSKKVQVDVRLDEVVLHALEKEPQRRYQQASEVKTDVETIASGSAGAISSAPAPIAVTPPRTTSDKTILPAFLLAFFFGVFGAHRFYVGKIGTAFLQLATFGGCGIWATIDWILIVCKAFTDRQGRRITEWVDADRVQSTPPLSTSTPGRPQGTAGAPAPISAEASLAAIKSKVTPPAIALLVAAGVKIFSSFAAGALLLGLGPILRNLERLTGLNIHLSSRSDLHFGAIHLGSIAAGLMLIPSAFVLVGALKMLRLQSHSWAMAAAILAIIFPPFHLIGIPIGIWALVILTQRDVREAFGKPLTPTPGAPATPGRAGVTATVAALAIGGFILLLAIPARALFQKGEEVREEFSYTAALAASGRFSLDNVNGRIDVTQADGTNVIVKGVKRGRSQKSVESVKIETSFGPTSVTVHTREPKKAGWWSDSVTVDYTVEVPEGVRLEKIESVNGEVAITGIRSDINASTVNGAVRAKGAEGNLKLSTVNGRITAEMNSLHDGQSVSLDTVNGQIGATLPSDADAEISAETLNGSIKNEFSSLTVKKDFPIGQKLKGRLGKGGGRLKATTVNGSIHIRQSKLE